MKYFIFSDVHGCYNELIESLEKIVMLIQLMNGIAIKTLLENDL